MAFAESCNFEKMNNNNYKQWKFNIKMQLLNLGLIEFVNKQEPVLDAEATKADKQNFELRKAKALSTICLSIDENLKSIVYNIDSPVAASQEIENVFEPRSRARIGTLRTKFLNILFLPSDTMSSYIGKISQAAKDLENAGKVIPDDEIAYQMLAKLPRSYDNLVMQLYQLDDVNFTSLNIQKSLLAEYDRVTVREKSEARPKEPAVFSIESDVSRKKNSTKEFKERRKCFFCGTVGHIRKNCWKFKNANKMPTHQQRKPPTFKQDELSNPAVFYASAYCTQSMDIEFVIDSAATEHFVNDINLFTNFQKLSSSASMAEGTTNILGKGDVSLEIMDNSANVIKMQNDSAAYISDKDGIELWHARFGHLNMQGLKDFSKSNNVYGLENLKGNVDKCDTCCLTKSSRASFPNIDKIRTQHVLELVHMDIWRPAPVKSLGGAEYFYSIIDDYSRYAVVYFLKHKNEAFECFKAYKQAMERLTNRKIKRVRSDNGT
ncbi:Retrovirus-related Pol polyprotein from transposon TNT 1-94 [Araneus ventricosus]|uniref:Retrovirus-related Pol polyprotein from transposon TNT 1-94 n=1 Tax=Araneus ventricosus TaxID=182803 RepID=A0A4Y2LUS5_ARAVE|nr:Retrovirus-related Pol polyprotein from transposon TNT 1-94 [Araneus ventricosus]GBN17819.1 Retrovirus-related Pol polyprotein from transposon TNT 1-94 [Araneus ventricosus]GBN17823.1 Retrovirus-related Pol polyprotein from transposon TNT 1-94 [Araneus ventricosus]GBN17835.1 Retrovirus-related Pol polyprotein from transposon TNT 1-94 [Araneus ventricosus]